MSGNPHYLPDYETYYNPESYNVLDTPIDPHRQLTISNRLRYGARRLGPAFPAIIMGVPAAYIGYAGYQTYKDFEAKQRADLLLSQAADARVEMAARKARVEKIRARSAAERERKTFARLGALMIGARPQATISHTSEVTVNEDEPVVRPPKPPGPPEPPQNRIVEILNAPRFDIQMAARVNKISHPLDMAKLNKSAREIMDKIDNGGLDVLKTMSEREQPALKFFTQEGFQNAVDDPKQYIPEVLYQLGGTNFGKTYKARRNMLRAGADIDAALKRNKNYVPLDVLTTPPTNLRATELSLIALMGKYYPDYPPSTRKQISKDAVLLIAKERELGKTLAPMEAVKLIIGK